jgi:hypothetical protein
MAWKKTSAKVYSPHDFVMQGVLDRYEDYVKACCEVQRGEPLNFPVSAGIIPKISSVHAGSSFSRMSLAVSENTNLVLHERLSVSASNAPEGGASYTFEVDVYEPNNSSRCTFAKNLQTKLDGLATQVFEESRR